MKINKTRSGFQYINIDEDVKYIIKENIQTAKLLAIKPRKKAIVKLTKRRITQLDAMLKDYCED